MKKHSRRTLVLGIVIAGMLLITGSLLLIYHTYKDALKPEIIVKGINIEDNGDQLLHVTATVDLTNRLPVDVVIHDLNFEAVSGKMKLLGSSYKKSFALKKAGTSRIDIPMQIKKSDAQKLMERNGGTSVDSTTCMLYVTFNLDLPIVGVRTFSLVRTLHIPVIRMISFEPGKLDLEKISLSKPEAKLMVAVGNDNKFTVRFNRMELALSIAKDMKLKGVATGTHAIPPKSKIDIPFDLKVDDLNPVKLVWKSMFKDEKAVFESTLTLSVLSEHQRINGSKIVFRQKGLLKDLKDGKKPLE